MLDCRPPHPRLAAATLRRITTLALTGTSSVRAADDRGARLGRSRPRGRADRQPNIGRYTQPPMSKVCAVCGKGPSFGNSRSHSMVATKRRFNPNLQRVRILVNGTPRREYVCARCLKSGRVQKAV
jgi:large subunit ribosomal protein L28